MAADETPRAAPDSPDYDRAYPGEPPASSFLRGLNASTDRTKEGRRGQPISGLAILPLLNNNDRLSDRQQGTSVFAVDGFTEG